jgi:cell wall-associated NlpC family hydrolase
MKLAVFLLALCLLLAVVSARSMPRYDYSMFDEEDDDEYYLQSAGSTALSCMKSHLGTPYVSGGNSWAGTDCSGSIQMCYKTAGVNLPRTSSAQCQSGRSVGLNEAQWQPGDLLCFPGHVALYVSNNRLIHEANPQKGLCETIVYAKPYDVRRF